MRLALDFDQTFDEAPDFWRSFIELARRHGHSVVCVTARRDTPENNELIEREFYPLEVSTYFTGLTAKKWFMSERGMKIDVWIDDNPEAILNGM